VEAIADWLVEFVHGFGYLGIFAMTFLESTFVPIPSELTMIPAGYLIHQHDMNAFWVLFSAITGTIGGSLANYYIAYHYGRRFLYAYGKYLFFSHEKMDKLDAFFLNHGEISTLTGRLIPGLRHFISFPAGLAHMKLKKFVLYTGVGGGLWISILVLVGYIIGGNKAMVRHYMPYITAIAILGVALMLLLYVKHHRGRKDKEPNGLI
jgi:membrane protein DedA with SNARE-associated domain